MLKDLISQYRDNRQRIATKYELIRQFQISNYDLT